MKWIEKSAFIAAALLTVMGLAASPHATAQEKKPNIVFITGDDVGWLNIGAYHQGMMAGKTPNLDQMAAEGMRFTDYYAEASCTAGRANFITGEIPIRTGMTTVGQVNDSEFAGAVRLNPKSKDPMIGTQDPAESIFVIPQANGAPPIKVSGFSTLVKTKAAAYCFLPSVTAIKFIANLEASQ
jgi:hypothetical protein